ncbi:MAG: hypothetical protein ABSE99_07560 [Terracidiphilus sp.]|jgi:hypothetical protein
MTTNAYLQDPTPVRTDGNLRFLFGELSRIEKFQNFTYVAAAVMIGIVVGVVFAAASGHAFGPSEQQNAASGNSPSGAVKVYSSIPAVQASTIQSPANNPATAQPPASPSSPAAKTATPVKTTVGGRQNGYRLLSAPSRFPIRRMASFKRSRATSEPPVPAVLPPSGPAPAFTFIIEGDLTVADYDAATSTIETQEGKNFVLGNASGEGNAAIWQDYNGNIHYRCDQSGSCTLFRHGIVVPNAKRTI